ATSGHEPKEGAMRRRQIRQVAIVGAFLGVLLPAAAPVGAAGGGARPTLPPKVKTSTAPSAGFRQPATGATAPHGSAVRLGFCGGDDWEPEIATDGGDFVYVVLAH